MKPSRFVRPQFDVLKISRGDTLTVRRRLTHGEQTASFARMYTPAGEEGRVRVDGTMVGMARVTAYLLDWSLTDEAGALVEIRNQPMDVLIAALNALDPDDFTEIDAAIKQHEADQAAARAQEKNARDGASASPAISPSPSDAAGDTSGSES